MFFGAFFGLISAVAIYHLLMYAVLRVPEFLSYGAYLAALAIFQLGREPQYLAVLEGLTVQLEAINASWDDVVFRRMYATDVPTFMQKCVNDRDIPLPWNKERPSPSTLIGVTALSNPDFLIEVEIAAVIAD